MLGQKSVRTPMEEENENRNVGLLLHNSCANVCMHDCMGMSVTISISFMVA